MRPARRWPARRRRRARWRSPSACRTPPATSGRAARPRSGSRSSGPPGSPRGHSWELRTASSAPPSAFCSALRSIACATAARQEALSIGATVVGSASSRIAPVVTSSTRSRDAVVGQPRRGRRLHAGAREVDVRGPGEHGLVALDAGQPGPDDDGSGSAVRTGSVARFQCGLRLSTMPVCGSSEVTMYGPGRDRRLRRRSPALSASIGTGLLEGSASTYGKSGSARAQVEGDRGVVRGRDRRQAELVLRARPGTGRDRGWPGRRAGPRRRSGRRPRRRRRTTARCRTSRPGR